MSWLYNCNIKQFLKETDISSPAELAEVKRKIADELESVAPFQAGNEEGASLVTEVRDALDQDDLNGVLQGVYDHADSEKVWLGL